MLGERRLPPITRAAVNLLVGRRCFSFTQEERRALTRAITLDRTFELPANGIRHGVRGKRRRHNVIYFQDASLPIELLEVHPTFVFIEEIIRQGKEYRNTALYSEMQEGRRLRRQTGGEGEKGRAHLQSDQEFELYYTRCLRLADSIREHGVVDLRSSMAHAFRESDAIEDNLSVGIDQNGEFVHYRRGKHRLAIAKALGIRAIPATGVFVSGEYLRNNLSLWATFIPTRLPSAIAKVLDDTERRAWTTADQCS